MSITFDTCICRSRDFGRAPPMQSIFIDRWVKVTGDVLHGAVHFPALAAGLASAISDRHPALTMCEGEQTRRSGRATIKARVLHRSFGTGNAVWIANPFQRRPVR